MLLSSCHNKDEYVFIQITDQQLGFKNIEEELDNLYKAISYINEIKPAFVVTGYMVHDKKSVNQHKAYHEHVSNIDKGIPIYHIPGNHDISEPFDSTLTEYKSRFGNNRFSFNLALFLFMIFVV